MSIKSTLVCLVTCSRDESRRNISTTVVKNLAEKIPNAGLSNSFIVFDNNSIFKEHLEHLPAGTKIIESPENIGYWTAIKWVLDNHQEVMNKTYDYIYMIESDLIHTDLHALAECERFLEENSQASCVRTQEFSVRWNWRYNKKLKFLPFRKMRSIVHMHNDVTKEKAWFRKVIGFNNIYLSNLHAKLPALNRMDLMKKIFKELSEMEGFGEPDFFRLSHKHLPNIGVLDGGLWHQLSTLETNEVISGSYSSPELLKKTGYQETRRSRILNPPQNIKISSAA
jgi:hypothetical protein